MGYACPVCDEHVPDAEHLADHLAFAAVTGADDHEEWLDEHAPGWEDGGTEDLAPRVTDYAEEVEFEVETEPVDGHSHGHGGHGHGDAGGRAIDTSGAGALDGEAQRILEEAAEMTRQMVDDADDDADAEGETE
ncbi:DUF5810 domain-containing protein [Halarchaeum sp. P4]|uniref:DUF5810 domain-containing protein n=1 Tax=Halarchaeum sp. P4 TaxID=3421639 RepID=UPI003EBB8F45